MEIDIESATQIMVKYDTLESTQTVQVNVSLTFMFRFMAGVFFKSTFSIILMNYVQLYFVFL